MKGERTLDDKPFRYGGIMHNYDRTSEEWAEMIPKMRRCYICGGKMRNIYSTSGTLLKKTYPYVGMFHITKGENKGKSKFRPMCRAFWLASMDASCASSNSSSRFCFSHRRKLSCLQGIVFPPPNPLGVKKYWISSSFVASCIVSSFISLTFPHSVTVSDSCVVYNRPFSLAYPLSHVSVMLSQMLAVPADATP